MAMTAAYALAHVFLPNFIKLKNAQTVMASFETKNKLLFDALWQQAHVTFDPTLAYKKLGAFRIGVINFPAPVEAGEAHFAALILDTSKSTPARYFTLEHDYVLKTKSNRTLVCERDGQKHIKHADGPTLTGTVDTDIAAFVDAFMAVVSPTSK